MDDDKDCPTCGSKPVFGTHGSESLHQAVQLLLNQYKEKLPPSIVLKLKYALANSKELERELELTQQSCRILGEKYHSKVRP